MDKEKQWFVDDADVVFRLGIIKELNAAGVDWLSREGLVYQRVRFWETDGKYGFMVEGEQTMSEHFVGSTPEQIKTCLQNLQRKGLVFHVQCDKRVYRNKTKVWMSAVRLAGASTAVEAIKVLAGTKKNSAELAEHPLELKALEGSLSRLPSHDMVTSKSPYHDSQVTNNRDTNKNRNKNEYIISPYANPGEGDDFSVGSTQSEVTGGVVKNTTPFGEAPTTSVKPAKNNNRFIAPLAQELLTLAGEKATNPGPALRAAIQARLKQGYTEADLRLIVRVGREDEFYHDKPLSAMLSENGASALLAKLKKKKQKSGLTKMARERF